MTNVTRKPTARTARRVAIAILAAATLIAGCDPWGNINLNIVIPLGLGGNTGILNPPESSQAWWPFSLFSTDTTSGSTGNAATAGDQA
jgi:hypothetical protein